MQILIQIDENLEETFKKILDKVLEKSAEGYNFHEKDPKFRIIYDYEELPIDPKIDFKEYHKQIFLEKMYETLSRGSDPHDD